MSPPYSMDANGNRNWRYRVCDIHVYVFGPWHLQDVVKEALEGGSEDLQFGPKDDTDINMTTNELSDIPSNHINKPYFHV